jgi:hypothetical protein
MSSCAGSKEVKQKFFLWLVCEYISKTLLRDLRQHVVLMTDTKLLFDECGKNFCWTAGVTSWSLATGQNLRRNGFLVSFYEDDMSPFVLRSLNMPWV